MLLPIPAQSEAPASMIPGSAEKRLPDPEVPREGPSRVRLERGPQGWGGF